MSKKLSYSCTALVGTNKTGTLKPDEHGYYYLCLGALNITSGNGIYYGWSDNKHIFESSSSFMRRVAAGNLYAENDHPKWDTGMSADDYVERILNIEKTNVCAHIRSVDVVEGKRNLDGTNLFMVYGWVKPVEEQGKYLKEALDNPNQNVCFSLRSTCNDKYVGRRIERTITNLVTFDWVTEPGISVANKFNSPALEGHVDRLPEQIQLEDYAIPVDAIERLLARKEAQWNMGIGTESKENYEYLKDYVKKHNFDTTTKIERSKLFSW